jgi:sugar phosphate isomerase/epimerase
VAAGEKEERMRIGLMVWEIGERSFLKQIEWARDNGFEEIAFHTCPLLAPRRGIDPEALTPQDWARLRAATAPFKDVDLHAPFENYDVSLVSPNERVREASVELVEDTLRAANRLRAKTVTIHPTTTLADITADERRELLAKSLVELDEVAAALGVRIGLETTEDFEVFERVGFESTGVTLDVGHVVGLDDGKALRPWGGLGGLIQHLGRTIVHVHLHDYDGDSDHLPLGAGRLDFGEIVASLKAVGYEGALCLELAPFATIEADLLRSRDLLRSLLAAR